MKNRTSMAAFITLAGLYMTTIACFGRLPFIDDVVFKSAGRQLAEHGTFTSPEFRYFVIPVVPSTEQLFAIQPPVYPICFAAWTKAFGFGWRQAFLFDAIIHIGLCGVTARLITVLLSNGPLTTAYGSSAWWAATLLIPTGTSGRPDELAVLLCLTALLVFLRRPVRANAVLAGCIGAVAAFASVAGVVCCGIAAMSLLLERGQFRSVATRVCMAAGSCTALVLVAIAVISVTAPDAIRQFLQHARTVSNLSPIIFNLHFSIRFATAPTIATAGLVTALIIVSISTAARTWLPILLSFLFAVGRLHNPYYLWFFTPVVVIGITVAGIRLWETRVKRSAVAIAFATGILGIALGALHPSLVNASLIFGAEEQGWAYNSKLLRERIPLGADVAADEHWFSLGNHGRVIDAYFSSAQAFNRVDYVVLTGNGSGKPSQRKKLDEAKEQIIERDFEEVSNNLATRPLRFFDIPLTRSAYGMGAVVLKRKSLSSKSSPPPPDPISPRPPF